MKGIASLVALQCAILVVCTPQKSLIITRIDNLENYAINVIENSNFIAEQLKPGPALLHLCRSLLAAPIYESKPAFRQLPNDSRIYRAIDDDKWMILKEQYTNDKSIQRRVLLQQKEYTLWTSNCMDHEQSFSWIISYHRALGVGFLFSLESSLRLFGIIDYTRRYNSYAKNTNQEDFQKTIEANSTDFELLCGLKWQSQFRLCSVCTDALHRGRKHVPTDAGYIFRDTDVDHISVADPYHNYVYDTSKNVCPKILVWFKTHKKNVSKDMKMLLCDTSVRQFHYYFYIKLNLDIEIDLNAQVTGIRDSVFIIKDSQLSGKVFIPQLENILSVDEHLQKGDERENNESATMTHLP